MKTVIVFLLLVGSASACGVETVHHANVNAFVVTNFAVPVGYPVAQQSPYYYATNPGYADPNTLALAVETGVTRALAKSGAMMNPNLAAAAKPQSLVAQKCGTCHGGANAAATAKLPFTSVEELDAAARLLCIRDIVKDKMPKGAPIKDAELAGKLIDELSAGNPPVAAAQPAQPPAPPLEQPQSNQTPNKTKSYTVPSSLAPEERPAPVGWTTHDGGKSWQSPSLVGEQKMYTESGGKWVEDKNLPPVAANPQ